jgi:hypothetical protein
VCQLLYWPGVGDNRPDIDLSEQITGCERRNTSSTNSNAVGNEASRGCPLDTFIQRSERYRPTPSIQEVTHRNKLKIELERIRENK